MDRASPAAVATPPGTFATTWRARSRDRLSREPAHTEWNALRLSLEALYEAAIVDVRPFEWACSDRERIGALDYCVSRAFRSVA